MTQVQTARPVGIPWDNPFSKVEVKMADKSASTPAWLTELQTKGVSANLSTHKSLLMSTTDSQWAIVKGAVAPDRAAIYADQAHDWLEGFNFGYKRDDKSTWQKKNLPRHNV